MDDRDGTAPLSVVAGGRDGTPAAEAPRLVLPPDWLPLVLVVGDALIAGASVLAAYALRTSNFSYPPARAQLIGPYLGAVPVVMIVSAFSLWVSRQYRSWRGAGLAEQLVLLYSGIGLATLLLLALAALTRPEEAYSRLFMLYTALIGAAGMTVERVILRAYETRLRRRGIGAVRVLLVGASDTSDLLIRRMTMFPAFGFAVCGVVDDRLEAGSRFAGVPVVGRPKDLARLVTDLAVDRCVLALPAARRDRLVELMRQCDAQRIPYQLVPDLLDLLDTRARAEAVDGVPLIGTHELRIGSPSWAMKRLIDLTVAWWGLVLLAPLLLLIAAAIRLTSPGAPALTRQERIGRYRRPFTAYGFRTAPPGPAVSAHAVGRLLRRTGLDALPQLVNVLRGDMSLVGPSPMPARLDERCGVELPRYPERGQVRPGLTGWALANRLAGGAGVEEQLVYDLYYIEHWSLGMDLRIILLTALRLLGR